MKVSIIIPVHNSEKTLERCLESILEQNFNEMEILLIENGSTDDSYAVCQKYAKKYGNIACYISSSKGVSAARNLGLEFATGDIIGFCDADDMLEGDSLKHITKIFEENSTVSMVVGGYYRVSSNDKTYMGLKKSKKCSFNKVLNHAIYDFRIMGSVWNKFFKRELLSDVRFDEGLSYCEDTHFLISVLSKNQNKTAYIINRPIYNYICNEQSVTRDLSNIFDENGKLKYICALEKMLELSNLKKYSRMLIKRQMFWLSIAYFDYASKEEKKILKKYITRCLPYYLITIYINLKQIPRTIIISLRKNRNNYIF